MLNWSGRADSNLSCFAGVSVSGSPQAKSRAKPRDQDVELVGTGRFELPTPRTPSGLTIFSVIYHEIPSCVLESVFMRLSARL